MTAITTAINGIINCLASLATYISNFFNPSQKEIEHNLKKLGWDHYKGDLWRHQKTGVIAAFEDAVAMELRTAVQGKKPFEGHFFKEDK